MIDEVRIELCLTMWWNFRWVASNLKKATLPRQICEALRAVQLELFQQIHDDIKKNIVTAG